MILSNILSDINIIMRNKGYIVNETSQKEIESIVLNEFEINTENVKYIYGINAGAFGQKVSEYIINKSPMIVKYIDIL